LVDFDWEWKKEWVSALMNKGTLSFSCPTLNLTFLVTHIDFPGESNKLTIYSQPLSLVPQCEVEPLVAKLKAHMHLFEAKAPPDDHMFRIPLTPGCRDFCCLF
jgi:hypothetical protein